MTIRLRQHIAILLLGILTPLVASAYSYRGKVTDGEGDPLIGALVRLADSNKSTVTDTEGYFTIETDKKTAKVQISYTGFIAEDIVIKYADGLRTITLTPDVNSLEEVVITATRTPKALKDVPVVTQLITATDLRKTDATNIQDLLTEELPGLEFGYAMTQETSLNMNGFGGKSILFLVDGERLAGETLDNVDFNRLNLDNAERVEVVKGAASALYGANAVGGVVNIITREDKTPWRLNVNSRYRSFGKEVRHGADLNLHSGKITSNTNLQYSNMQTVKLASAFDTQSNIQSIFGGHTLNVKERLSLQATDNLKLTMRGGYFDRASRRVNYSDHYTDYSGGLRSMWNITPGQSLEMSYSYDQYDKKRFVDDQRTHDHDYSNRQHIVHGLYTHFFGSNALTVGADYMYDYLTTYQFTDNGTHTQSTVDAFVQFDYTPVKWFNVVASIRDDYFSASDNNALTGRLATMFKFDGFSIRANYAGGFRAPTLKEMYMDFDMAGIQMIYGNPDLKPEKSHNFNLALEHNGRIRSTILAGSYSLTGMGYYNWYNSRITTTDHTGPDGEEGAMYVNENGVRVSGLDVSARYRSTMGLGLQINYNYLHVGGSTIDSQFSQPRPHSMTWRIDYDKRLCSFYSFYAGLSGRYLSKPVSAYDTDSAYSLWKFTLQQEVWRGIRVNFVVDNLLNYKPKVYYWNTYPTKGRNWSIGVSLDINDFF